jgi:hypothetical protein
MKSFIDKTIKPFLIIAGLGTCVAGLLVFLPRFALENIFKLPFVEDYTIFCQHWGLMVLLVGIFMIISAFSVSWRRPVLIYSAIEKTLSETYYPFLTFVVAYIFSRAEAGRYLFGVWLLLVQP